MSTLNIPDKDLVLVCGDIHGDYDIIPNYLKKHGLKNVAIIQLGDFGIGWERKDKEIKKLMYLNSRLAISNSHIFAIRGNHDDPYWFLEYFSTGYVHLIPDYTILNMNKHNFLCIGGAVSIDRTDRKAYFKGKGIGWWKDEIISYNNMTETVKDIDIIISHTSPSFTAPLEKHNLDYWFLNDETLSDDIDIERNTMTKIYNNLNKNNDIKYWYYGHFHFNNTEMINNTIFKLLNVNEITEHKNK